MALITVTNDEGDMVMSFEVTTGEVTLGDPTNWATAGLSTVLTQDIAVAVLLASPDRSLPAQRA